MNDFQEATIRLIVHPSFGWNNTCTWFGITHQACSVYRTPWKQMNASCTKLASSGSRNQQLPCPASRYAITRRSISALRNESGVAFNSSHMPATTSVGKLSANRKHTCCISKGLSICGT